MDHALVLQLTSDPTIGLEVFLHLFFFFSFIVPYFTISSKSYDLILSEYFYVLEDNYLFEHNFEYEDEIQ